MKKSKKKIYPIKLNHSFLLSVEMIGVCPIFEIEIRELIMELNAYQRLPDKAKHQTYPKLPELGC